jgi:hypothetical protein
MIQLVRASHTLLQELTDAYVAGDAPLGEYLLGQALDAGEAWDEVCAAAARGIAQRHAEQQAECGVAQSHADHAPTMSLNERARA